MSLDLTEFKCWSAPPPELEAGLAVTARAGFRGLTKRCLDVAGAILLLVLSAPVFVLAALAARADGGPAFFRHERVGRSGRCFACLKFRTMRLDADIALARLLDLDEAAREEWEATRKLRHDPRITSVGRFLRTTSLDELPQLLNVLRGEMSLVGPRPVVREELEQHYGAAAADYMRVRPGITGPWQVSGRSETGYAERVAFDAAYANATPSIRHDLSILVRTVGAVLRCKGAY